ncbi:MAG: diguanylate cyclase [Planctomyces sp.]|nr:diguanylate cyclase [Planctomyces sp.]
MTITASATASAINNFSDFSPALPTDTNGILLRLLALAEDSRRMGSDSDQKPIIPRPILAMLLRAIKLRDPSLLGHCQRIAAISSGVAQQLGWNSEQRLTLEVAALLHDLGKLGVPEHILHKPGKLSSEEYDFVLLHHHAAVCLLQAVQTDSSVTSMLNMLHHNFDGGKLGADIDVVQQDLPLGPRILAVADAYDSLSTPKPYRRGMTHAEVMNMLEEKSGSRYDGNVVRCLGRWYETEGEALFRYTEPLQSAEAAADVSEQHYNEVVLLTQIINILYQFQQLYDGYFVLDMAENYCVWSEGMLNLTGIPGQNAVGRAWQPSDVQLASLTEDRPFSTNHDDTTVGQVFKNGRPQFSSQLCRMSEARHFKVDVYTFPVTGPRNQIMGVVQLLRNKSGVRRHSREYVELKLAATRDPLTGVANRGQLETQLRHFLEDFHAHEGTRNLSVIFLDVDRFKRINDTYGHQTGDEVLVDLTRLLQHETYSGEIIGRYGGEEFVLLCPDTDLESAVRRAERLRTAIMKSSIGGVSTLSVTSSFGVSTARLGDSVQTLVERADACLYRAKETGRNRTCWETEEVDEHVSKHEGDEKPSQVCETEGGYEFNDRISVSTSLELTGLKMQAFLAESGVQVLSQEQGTIRLKIGTLGFTRRWGSTRNRQPLEIEIRFEAIRGTSPIDGKPRTNRFVCVKARPVGKVPDLETFSQRCIVLIRELRAYLLSS